VVVFVVVVVELPFFVRALLASAPPAIPAIAGSNGSAIYITS
jgi:hypothetical protein